MADYCDKHDECMKDIREAIHNQELSQAELKGTVEAFVEVTQDYIKASRKDLYSKEGLMDRVGNHGNQLLLQWGLSALIIGGIIVAFLKA